MPKATVNGSPCSMARSPGLSSPSLARGPAVSMRWHDSGLPSQPSRPTASRSVRPGRSPARSDADPVRGHARRRLHRRQLLHLVDRPQAVGRIDQQVAGVLDRAGPSGQVPQHIHDEGRDLHGTSVRVRLPADDADGRPRPDALVAQDLGEWQRPVARLGRQAQVLEPMAAHRQGRRAGHVVALVADQDGRVAVRRHDEDRLLEPRVEAGQVRQVGAVLPIGIDDETVVATIRHAGTQSIQPIGVEGRLQLWPRRVPAEVGQRHLGESGGPLGLACHRSLLVTVSTASPRWRRARWWRRCRPRS